MALLASVGCYVSAASPGVSSLDCGSIDYQYDACASDYLWVPGYWSGGVWLHAHYEHRWRGSHGRFGYGRAHRAGPRR